MPVLIKLSTTLREHVPGYNPAEGLSMELHGPATVGDMAERIGLPLSQIKITMLNGAHASLDNPLADGDRVAYFPAVGGG